MSLALTYLSGPVVEQLALTDEEILGAVLAAQSRDETVTEPRTHLFPRGADGHFNVLRGATPRFAGLKVVGDFVENHRLGLPSELALLLLMDPMTGVPRAVIDATAITEIRTGAVTALGADVLARRDARVLGHIGARGTAYWNVRLCRAVLPELREVRVHGRAASTSGRPSSSGTAGCRSPTSPSARRCWTVRRPPASARSCHTATDPAASGS